MNLRPQETATDDWLDDLLARGAEVLPADDGFSTQVARRIDAVARAAGAAEPAPCIAPTAALSRLPALQQRERRRQSWTAAGVLMAAAIGILTLWAQPGSTSGAALVLASIGLLWLLLRDPQF
jgi:ferric-dicitrate binding protein FerR (iron transport regulator)